MYQLRDYQSIGKRQLYQKIKEGKRKIIIWKPTGTGKGLLMSDIAKDVTDKGKRCLTVLRRRELIFQTRDNYEKYHKHVASIIMGSEKGYLHWSFTQICSIDTIRQRMKDEGSDQTKFLKTFDVIIIDECHDTNSETYQTFLKWIDPDDNKIFIGFTATPFSMGGKPLLFWEDIVQPLTAAEARDRGFLVSDITYIPESQINLDGLEKSSTGDYKEADLFKRASENELIGNFVRDWMPFRGRPTMFFGVNKEHIRLVCARFLSEGVSAICIDDSTTSEERSLAKKKSRSGEVEVVCSVGVLTTGADWPWISLIQLGRATESLVLFIQIVGRGLRPFKVCASCNNEYGGDPFCFKCKSNITSFIKDGCVVLDHGSNIIRHGLIYQDRKAKLAHKGYEAKSRNNEAPNVRITTCQSCFAVYSPSLPCCPLCATVNAPSQVVKEKDGKLRLIDEATMKKLQLNQCRSTLEHLITREGWYNWKPAAKWFQLHKQCGDVIFEFEKELGLPWWLKSRVGIHEVKNE